MAKNGCSSAYVEYLEHLQSSSARGTIKIICDVRQEHLERGRATCPECKPFLLLSEQIIDEAIQAVCVIVVSLDGRFDKIGVCQPGT